MEIINHESYVSLEVAKLLKEAGFDWKVNTCHYNSSPDKVSSNGTLISNFNGYAFQHIAISAPTLDVAQRWLREVKDIDVYIFPTTNTKRRCVYEWGIKTFGCALWVEGQPYTNQYETYEEAQQAGIKKALEIILEK